MNLTKHQLERVTRAAYEVVRAYARELGEDMRKDWSAITGEERESLREGVVGVLSGRLVTLKDQHDAWRQAMVDQGWAWGPVKVVSEKLHPALVEFEQLPFEQRVKGAIFRAAAVEAQLLLMEPKPCP